MARCSPYFELLFDAERECFHEDTMRDLVLQLDLYAVSPIEYLARVGRIMKECMYCGAAIVDPESLERGIGPVCYKNMSKMQRLYFKNVAQKAMDASVGSKSADTATLSPSVTQVDASESSRTLASSLPSSTTTFSSRFASCSHSSGVVGSASVDSTALVSSCETAAAKVDTVVSCCSSSSVNIKT